MTQSIAAPLDTQTVAGILRSLLADVAGIAPELITEDSSFSGALAMDSLTFVQFQVEIELTFGIECLLDELRALTRFDEVVRLVAGKVEDRAA